MVIIAIFVILALGGLVFSSAFCKTIWTVIAEHTPWWIWAIIIALGVAFVRDTSAEKKKTDSLGLYEYRLTDRWMGKGEYRISCRDEKVTRVISSERLPSRQIKEVVKEIEDNYPNEKLIFFLTAKHNNYDDQYAVANLRDSIIIMNPLFQRDTIYLK
ncbi:MAG: hypothetical protein IKT59_09020 [Bacteroidales bacterium]|nr:hypothetical protein [Bacteroidales bacterium]